MGIESILKGEVCVIILMGERGQENIQSNLESFLNLQKLTKKIDLNNSNSVKNKPVTRQSQIHGKPKKSNFKSTTCIRTKSIEEPELSISEINVEYGLRDSDIDRNEKRFEETLKKETKRRDNPLDLLSRHIKSIKSLCDRLAKVVLEANS